MTSITIPLRNTDLFQIDLRIEEVQVIRDWIRELANYDESKFEIRYISTGDCLKVWFEDDKLAMLCALRWQ